MQDHRHTKVLSHAHQATSSMSHELSSTGSAGLIQTIQMFARHSWAAAILGTIATVGWVLQGLGNAFYYREVSRCDLPKFPIAHF